MSILLVDHKLDFITALCDRVAVLELGPLVALGPAATVFSDQRVIDAYLGLEEGEGAQVLTTDQVASGDGNGQGASGAGDDQVASGAGDDEEDGA